MMALLHCERSVQICSNSLRGWTVNIRQLSFEESPCGGLSLSLLRQSIPIMSILMPLLLVMAQH